MAGIWRTVCESFWNEWFWFPEKYSWDCMKNTDPKVYKPQASDLFMPVYLCVVITIVRTVFERSVAFVAVRVFPDLIPSVKNVPVNPMLEKAYSRKKILDSNTLQALSKQTDWNSRQIERWFRRRRNQDRTPVIKKFCESSWRCTYYAVIFCYGLYTLWDKEWLWKTEMCWKGWPEHNVSPDLYWYYAVQAGFYLSLSLSLFVDHKRKDFMEMIVHHFATLGLMFFSWMNNFVRVGSLVLLVHDCADPIMEAAKMAKYVKNNLVCNSLFVIFVITWIATRMTIFPTRYDPEACDLCQCVDHRSTGFKVFLKLPCCCGLHRNLCPKFSDRHSIEVLYLQVSHRLRQAFTLPVREKDRIIYSTLYEAVPEIGMCFVYYVYNTLLITLQVLHIIWFYFIVLIAKEAAVKGGEVKKDSRSSDESISEDSSSNGKEHTKQAACSLDKNGQTLLEQNGTASQFS